MSGPWLRSGTNAAAEEPGLIWLASYPKSGNTWIRSFVTQLVCFRGAEVALNRLHHEYYGDIASSAAVFERFAGLPFDLLPRPVVDNLRPEVYVRWGAQVQHPTLVKVHDAWRLTSSGKQLFPEAHSLGCIYIVRNPLDVAVSMAPFYDISLDAAIGRLCNPEDGLAMKHDQGQLQLPQIMFDWSGHVESWIDSPIPRKLVLRYEDMLADTPACMRTLLDCFGIPYTEAALAQAVAGSSFKSLQVKEQKEGFKERNIGNTPFFRSGKAGGWREALTDAQVERIISCHGRVMARLGYLDDMEKLA